MRRRSWRWRGRWFPVPDSQHYYRDLLSFLASVTCPADEVEGSGSIELEHRVAAIHPLYWMVQLARIVVILHHLQNRVLPALVLKHEGVVNLESIPPGPTAIVLRRLQHPAISPPNIEDISVRRRHQTHQHPEKKKKTSRAFRGLHVCLQPKKTQRTAARS